MGFSAASKAVLLVQLSLLLLSSFTVFAQILPEALPPHYHGISPVIAPVPPPRHHHHHHHHHPHPHPPTPPPTKPPTHQPVYPPPPKAPAVSPVYPPPKPPVHPPPKPPTKPPTHAPPKPPTKPPTYAPPKPPVHPPPKPPTYAPPKPPVHPPPKPPVHPPTKPPTTHSPPKPPVRPPTKPPTQPPTKPPVHPPTYPPSHPPAKPPRSFVAVQGVVYCKSCKYAGSETLLGAKPIFGATVKLTCMNTKYKQEVTAKTDKNGYFYLQAPKTVTSFGAHKCAASLVSSPLTLCNKPSNLHLGLEGAPLRPEKPFTVNKLPFILYTVGPFAFEPKCY